MNRPARLFAACGAISAKTTCIIAPAQNAIIPGSAFGVSGEGYARISYAYSVDHLQTAMKRIREFLTEHGWIKK